MLNTQTESREDFVKRINKAARQEDDTNQTRNDSGRWLIGSKNRNLGSIHSDVIETMAAEIATCKYIGVFPVIGWWRERHHLGKWNKKTRYSIIVSLETPIQEVDLYNLVLVKLNTEIKIKR